MALRASMPIRETSRIVLLNPRDEIFLFEHNSPHPMTREKPAILRYWVTPGGGLEPGETHVDAAHRELWEETGLRSAEIGPCIWRREKPALVAGEDVLVRERYFLVRTEITRITNAHQMADERRVYQNHRWWPIDALRTTTDIVFPEGLADLLAPILAGDLPARPLHIGP